MRYAPSTRRSSSVSSWLGLLLVLLLITGGAIGTLWALGVNLNPFAAPPEDPFVVRLPINSQPIPAYQRVERGQLMDAKTGKFTFQKVPPQSTVGMSIIGITNDGSHVEGKVQSVRNDHDSVVFVLADGREVAHNQTIELGGVLMNVGAIVGRVVKKDKRPGLAFREDNFFPQGTPEGIAGATPPGMRAVTLDATKLNGVYALNAGDQVDLLASVPASEVGSFNSQYNNRLPSAVSASSKSDKLDNAVMEPILLAQKAVVLKPVYVRNEASASSTLTQGKKIQNVPKYEVAIAVAPDDVMPLQSALAKSVEITCITHSMQPTKGKSDEPLSTASDFQAPVTVRPILAYDVVNREAFVSPATRRLRMEPVSQQQIDRLGIITSVEEALGAVTRHDIPAGSFLRKSDLLSGKLDEQTPSPPATGSSVRRSQAVAPLKSPTIHFATTKASVASHQPADARDSATAPSVVGDRPAITSFVPAGRTAFAIPWNRIYGAEHLQIGDRIDLLTSYSLESENESEETETRADGTRIVRKREDISTRTTLRSWDESFGARGESWFVASDALIVGPVGFPAPASAQRALGEHLQRKNDTQSDKGLSGHPVMIAVDDRDVETVAAALATKRALFTVAFHPTEDLRAIPAGMKRVAVAAQTIEAFELFSEQVWQGNRRRSVWRLVAADDPNFATALSHEQLSEYFQRVLRHTKRRGDFFTANDFFPAGTQPGVAASVPDGQTLFAVADREIEGLDSFATDDWVTILVRGVVKPPKNVIVHGVDLERPVSSVIVSAARIVRASRAGQTVLAISNHDLTRLQAAWAASMAREEQVAKNQRSHLLAVALPRRDSAHPAPRPVQQTSQQRVTQTTQQPTSDSQQIPSFDSLEGMKFLESLVGKTREVHGFAPTSENSPTPSQPQLNFTEQGL